jgi:outer membrane protein
MQWFFFRLFVINYKIFNLQIISIMLSKISIAINILLLIAVINLYVKTCDNNSEPDTVTEVSSNNNPVKIAYIDTDSLNVHYEYVKDITAELNKEIAKKERRLERKTTKLQSEFTQLQRMSPNMTPQQLQGAQQRAVEMEREVQTLQNDLSIELNEEQAEMQIKLVEKLDSFMTKYNETEQYDYILKKFAGSEILIAKDAYDITDTIISLLNEDYLKANK